jgi:hypothetical protein
VRNDPDWEELLSLEPGLSRLLETALAVRDNNPDATMFCTYQHRLRIKARAIRLVGFQARNPDLRSMDAYTTALENLYAALPDCRNCPCLE